MYMGKTGILCHQAKGETKIMTDLFICIGSSCHLRGAQGVTEKLKQLILEQRLTQKVTLKASFCMDDCINGCCLSIGDKKLRHVSVQNLEEIFETEILPEINKA